MPENEKKKELPTGEEIRAAFEKTRDSNDSGTSASQPEKKRQRAKPENLERNTLTMSLIVVLLGLFCLGNIERGSDTWYVLMIVFAINAGIIIWVIQRKLQENTRVKSREKREHDTK